VRQRDLDHPVTGIDLLLKGVLAQRVAQQQATTRATSSSTNLAGGPSKAARPANRRLITMVTRAGHPHPKFGSQTEEMRRRRVVPSSLNRRKQAAGSPAPPALCQGLPGWPDGVCWLKALRIVASKLVRWIHQSAARRRARGVRTVQLMARNGRASWGGVAPSSGNLRGADQARSGPGFDCTRHPLALSPCSSRGGGMPSQPHPRVMVVERDSPQSTVKQAPRFAWPAAPAANARTALTEAFSMFDWCRRRHLPWAPAAGSTSAPAGLRSAASSPLSPEARSRSGDRVGALELLVGGGGAPRRRRSPACRSGQGPGSCRPSRCRYRALASLIVRECVLWSGIVGRTDSATDRSRCKQRGRASLLLTRAMLAVKGEHPALALQTSRRGAGHGNAGLFHSALARQQV